MITVFDLFYEAVKTVGCHNDLGGEIFQTTKHTVETISGEFKTYEDYDDLGFANYKKLFYVRDTRILPPLSHQTRTTSWATYAVCIPRQNQSPVMYGSLEKICDEMNRQLAIYRLVSL